MKKKTNKKSNWKPTEKRFVAFLDILGFKDLVMRKSHDEIYESLKQISKSKKLVEESPLKLDLFGDAEVYVVSFSDSIVIFSKNDSFENFYYFLLATRWFFTGVFNKRIPLKGALAHGEISLNKSEQIYFGQPIIDAYLMEEDVNYMGIVAHNTIDSYLSKLSNKEKKQINGLLFESKTTLKCGYLTHTNLNWFKIIKHEDNKNPESEYIRNKINLFKESASGTARKYIDNTLDMLNKNETKLMQ